MTPPTSGGRPASSRASIGRSTPRLAVLLSVGAACAALCGGCGDGPESTADREQVRAAMKVLGLQYGAFVTEHNGLAPPDEATLREYLRSRLAAMSAYGVKAVDDLLPLGRDGKPLLVVYGDPLPTPGRSSYVWAAHESDGINGVRLMCDSRGGVHSLTQEEFAEQLAGR